MAGQGDILDPFAWSAGGPAIAVGSVPAPTPQGDVMNPNAWRTGGPVMTIGAVTAASAQGDIPGDGYNKNPDTYTGGWTWAVGGPNLGSGIPHGLDIGQWRYLSAATIQSGTVLVLPSPTEISTYTAIGFDDSSWSIGVLPMGDTTWAGTPTDPGVPTPTYRNTVATQYSTQTQIWARRRVVVTELPTAPITVQIFADNGFALWVNGTQVGSNYTNTGGSFTATIPANLWVLGTNVLAAFVQDDLLHAPTDYAWFDFRWP